MHSNIAEIYRPELNTLDFIEKFTVVDATLDIDSLARQNGNLTLLETPKGVSKGDIVIVTDTSFSYQWRGIIVEISERNITFIAIEEYFSASFIFENVYGLDLEGYLYDTLKAEYADNNDAYQARPYFKFSTQSVTPGDLIEPDLIDGKTTLMTHKKLIEKLALEFNIYIRSNFDWDLKEITFYIARNEIGGLIIDTEDVGDVVSVDIKIEMSGKNKVDVYQTDAETGRHTLMASYVLLKDGTSTTNLSHPDRVPPPVSEGTLSYSSSQAYDIQAEVDKFFKNQARSNNHITFKLRSDSKIYDNQELFVIGSGLIVRHNGVPLPTVITGRSHEIIKGIKQDQYNSYICGFKRKSLLKKLRQGGVI